MPVKVFRLQDIRAKIFVAHPTDGFRIRFLSLFLFAWTQIPDLEQAQRKFRVIK